VSCVGRILPGAALPEGFGTSSKRGRGSSCPCILLSPYATHCASGIVPSA
jgi:hypothetical protein